MDAAGTSALMNTGLGVLVLIVLCYASGRMHQWVRQAFEREMAYREGYDTATRSLFSLATRALRGEPVAAPPAQAAPAPVRAVPQSAPITASAPVRPAPAVDPPTKVHHFRPGVVARGVAASEPRRARHRRDDDATRKLWPRPKPLDQTRQFSLGEMDESA